MENKINIACFKEGSRTAEVRGIWQWDYGQILRIQGLNLPSAVEIHFSLDEHGGEAVRRIGLTKDGVTDVPIPDSMVENESAYGDSYYFFVYIYLTDETSGNTEYKIRAKVSTRSKPEGYVSGGNDTFAEILKTVNEIAEEKVDVPVPAKVGQVLAVKSVDEEGKPTEFEAHPIEETDPTVPEWAKQPEKPTYTASEVGADAAGTAESKVSAHNVSDTAHNDIRLLVQGLAERLNTLADSDDETLDQMSEVVAYIKSNKNLIDAITTSKINVSDIIDNLTANVSNKPLSAAQGVKLKALIDAIAVVELDESLTDNTKAAPAGMVGELKSDIAEIKDDVKPINLYNKNSELNHNDVKVQASGNFIALSGSSVSHPIKIELGKTYCFKFSTSYYGTNANKIVRFCNADGTLITTDGTVYNANVASGNGYGYFTVTESLLKMGEYVCVNVRMSDKSVMIFAEGDTLPEYSDYFEPYAEIKESVLPKFVKTVNGVSPDDNGNINTNTDVTVLHNTLYGKKLAVNGDSICYGAGDVGGYAKYIGQRNDMTIANNAQSGGTLAYVSGRHCISRTIANMPTDADYYILEGGSNDVALGVPIGNLSSGYTATLDDTTFYGAMESVCKQMITKFKGKKYGFLIVHQMKGGMQITDARYIAIIECCNKWGIPYLDLAKNCVPFGLFEKDWGNDLSSLRNTYTADDGTGYGDGWHPNEECYKKYYVPKIEEWLKTL